MQKITPPMPLLAKIDIQCAGIATTIAENRGRRHRETPLLEHRPIAPRPPTPRACHSERRDGLAYFHLKAS